MRWAVIWQGLVVNVVLWDGASPWDHGADSVVSLDDPSLAEVSIGWTWDGTTFSPPPEPPQEQEEAA